MWGFDDPEHDHHERLRLEEENVQLRAEVARLKARLRQLGQSDGVGLSAHLRVRSWAGCWLCGARPDPVTGSCRCSR